MGQAQQGAGQGAEGAAGEQHGDDLAPPEARPQGEGGEEDLQQEGRRDGLPLHQPADDRVPRPVVGLLPHQQGEQQHQGAPRRRPEERIGQVFGVHLGGGVDDLAEQNGGQSAQQAQPRRLEHGHRGQGRRLLHRIGGRGVEAELPGHQQARQSGHQTGDHGGVVHDPHADHLHGKDGGGQRRAEQGGEGGGHAAHNHDALVLFVQAEAAPGPGGQGAPQLEGSPLPAGGAPAQVGQGGGGEDQRGGAQPQGARLPHRHQHQVGAPVLLHAAGPVEQHDDHPRQGQQENQPGVPPPQAGGPVHLQQEGHRRQPHRDPDHAGVQHPPEKDAPLPQVLPQPVRSPHLPSPLSPGPASPGVFLSGAIIAYPPAPGQRPGTEKSRPPDRGAGRAVKKAGAVPYDRPYES